jgi:hypothetical protein
LYYKLEEKSATIDLGYISKSECDIHVRLGLKRADIAVFVLIVLLSKTYWQERSMVGEVLRGYKEQYCSLCLI